MGNCKHLKVIFIKKIFFVIIQTLTIKIMKFCIWRKACAWFSRHLFTIFCVSGINRYQKLWCHDGLHWILESTFFSCFFWILCCIKMKLGEILLLPNGKRLEPIFSSVRMMMSAKEFFMTCYISVASVGPIQGENIPVKLYVNLVISTPH